MRKLLHFLAVLGVLSVSSLTLAGGLDAAPISDDQGVYVGVHGGAVIPGGDDSDFFENGYNLGAQAGYRFNKNLRAEAAFDYMRNNVKGFPDNTHLNFYTIMANAYYDIQINDSPIVPFIGGGIGYSNTSVSGAGFESGSDSHFAYQGIAGLAYHVTAKLSIDAKYRILGASDASGHQNIIEAGISYAV